MEVIIRYMGLMNLKGLFEGLPIELQYIVGSYDHLVFFRIFPISELLAKYDWFKLMRVNFGLSYSKGDATNKEMMAVYYNKCRYRKSGIACGAFHTIVRVDGGTLMGAGDGYNGQFGKGMYHIGYKEKMFMEIKVAGVKDIMEVIAGDFYTIIRRKNGILMSCGLSVHGSLGLGEKFYKSNLFQEIPGIPKNIVEVKGGQNHVIIRLTDGTLMGCGCNTYGQLGLGDYVSRYSFVEIPGIAKNVSSVICGRNNTIIKLTDGTLLVCGYNDWGQLGLGFNKNINIFEEVKGIPKNIAEVVCGGLHTIIRLTDGTLMSSGFNNYGELGNGDTQSRNLFEEIRGIPKNIAEVACGSVSTIIRLTNGKLMACGHLCGESVISDRSYNVLFEEIPEIPKSVVQIICGNRNTFIRLANGQLMSYGHNEAGQLGVGDFQNRTQFTNITQKRPWSEKCAIS
ncbi:MAG: chromosome condensation regulator [Hyperionvirus sp.]|uniref:Chromosome condensation regulator n=1 Tax=Hyperionvirus sp. TaxID=2487770 RepID=A0A3G5ABV6_9VIRU|nr:MAG: chromosome condensation regulator [Hyperionvirus sp.]